MLLTTFTRQELLDMRSEARADYQAARRSNDQRAMCSAFSDMNAIDIELSSYHEHNTIVELPN